MTLFTICISINIILVTLEGLRLFFKDGHLTVKAGIIVILTILILSGLPGTVMLVAVMCHEKYLLIRHYANKEINLFKDSFLSDDGSSE